MEVKVLNGENFDGTINEKGPVLVDFYASWCGPCQMMSPILDEVAKEAKEGSVVAKIDIDDNKDLANKYGVRSVPTLILFENGVEKERIIGLQTKEALLEYL